MWHSIAQVTSVYDEQDRYSSQLELSRKKNPKPKPTSLRAEAGSPKLVIADVSLDLFSAA